MNLLMNYLKNAHKTLAGENVVIRAIGSRSGLSKEMCDLIDDTERFTAKNTGIVMNIALNYGGREEIVHAAKKLAEEAAGKEIAPEAIDERLFSEYLYTAGQPDVDLLIRTSGEKRLSNFMLWQTSYAEMWFTNKNWPEFSKDDLYEAIFDYQNRGRRFGAV